MFINTARAAVAVLVILAFGAGIYGLSLHTPAGFLPEEDQGVFFIQFPDGASIARTSEVVRQVKKLMLGFPQVQDTFAVIGFSLLDGGNEANNAFMLIEMKPFADRQALQDLAQSLIRETFDATQQDGGSGHRALLR